MPAPKFYPLKFALIRPLPTAFSTPAAKTAWYASIWADQNRKTESVVNCPDVMENKNQPGTSAETVPRRLLSLDAFRGFDMFWIMGGDYIIRSLPKIHDSAFTRALAA